MYLCFEGWFFLILQPSVVAVVSGSLRVGFRVRALNRMDEDGEGTFPRCRLQGKLWCSSFGAVYANVRDILSFGFQFCHLCRTGDNILFVYDILRRTDWIGSSGWQHALFSASVLPGARKFSF